MLGPLTCGFADSGVTGSPPRADTRCMTATTLDKPGTLSPPTEEDEEARRAAARLADEPHQQALADHLMASAMRDCQLMGWNTNLYGYPSDWAGGKAKVLLPNGPQRDGTYIVTLSRMTHLLSARLGGMRHIANADKHDSADMSLGLGHDEPTAQMRAVCGEFAGWIALQRAPDLKAMIWRAQTHHLYRHQSDIPDLDIEIRTVWKDWYEPSIHFKDHEDDRLFMAFGPVTPELYQWRMLGTGVCSELWEKGHQPKWWPEDEEYTDQSARAVKRTALDRFDIDALLARGR